MAVAQAGSFSKASDKLGLTQSAVSKAIAVLENRLNASLFLRTTRKVKLTEDGENYYHSCTVALQELEQAEEKLNLSRSVKGVVRLDLPVLYGKKKILPIILKLADKYPDTEFVVTFDNTPIDLMDENVDLAIRIGHLDDVSSLKARLLGTQPIVVCASPKYLKSHGTPESKEDLKDHFCVVDAASKSWIFAKDEHSVQRSTVKSRLRLQGVDACLTAALQGHGLVQVPKWLAEPYISKKELVPVLKRYEVALPIHAIWFNTRLKTQSKIHVIIQEIANSL